MKTSMIAMLLASLLLAACSASGDAVAPSGEEGASQEQSSPTPTEPRRVTFQTEDGITLAGTLFGSGEMAVILAHQGTTGANQNDWHAFAQVLAERGFTALAFDFRGIGRSEGAPDRSQLDLDLMAAMQYLRDQGCDRMICIGASMGGTTCMRVALDHGGLEGLVALGSAMITDYGSGIRVSRAELDQLTLPKLFIAGEDEISLVVHDIATMYEYSPEPKEILWLPGYVHGTDLFSTEAGETLTNALLDFVDGVVSEDSNP